MFDDIEARAAVAVTMPTLWQWFKAGVGFTLGAGVVTVAATVCYMSFMLPVVLRVMLGLSR